MTFPASTQSLIDSGVPVVINVGDMVRLDSGELLEIVSRLPCGAVSRRDFRYAFRDTELSLTGREIALNTRQVNAALARTMAARQKAGKG